MTLTAYWVIRFSPLWEDISIRPVKLCDLPACAVVECLDEYNGDYMRVRYTASKVFEGWVLRNRVEEVIRPVPYPLVDLGGLQTSSQQDAAQYVVMFGNVQYNLCGELCVCSIVKEKPLAFLQPKASVTLDELMVTWQAKPLSAFQRIFRGGKSRTTGIPDLLDMLQPYGCLTYTLADALRDPTTGTLMLSPGRLGRFLDTGWQAIVGVKIEPLLGELRGQGIPHWVVIRAIQPTGVQRGKVEIYNPFSNSLEFYSWGEIIRSMGSPFGLLVHPPV